MVFISEAHKICASPKTDDNMFQVPEVSVFKNFRLGCFIAKPILQIKFVHDMKLTLKMF